MAEPAGRQGAGVARRYIIGQFRRPHGWLGKAAGWTMATRGSNRERNRWTVELMDLGPSDRVLEIGFGPGLALARVCDQLRDRQVVGLDHSPEMLEMAGHRNGEHVSSGKLRLCLGDAEDRAAFDQPDLRGPFSHVFAVNVSIFWRDPEAVLRRLRERLSEDGKIFLTNQPRIGDRSDAASISAARRLAGHAASAGFSETRIEAFQQLTPSPVCVLASS